MKVAQKRNAVQEGMFYFRKDIFKGENMQLQVRACSEFVEKSCSWHLFGPPTGCNPVLDGTPSAQNGLETDGANEEYTLMSIDTIINGKVITTLPLWSRPKYRMNNWMDRSEKYHTLLTLVMFLHLMKKMTEMPKQFWKNIRPKISHHCI